MNTHKIAALALGLLLPAFGAARAAELQIPSLAQLQRDAVESVDITLGPSALGFLGFMTHLASDHDPDAAVAHQVLRGLQEIQVHNFTFACNHAAAQAGDVDALRTQLAGPGWRRLVQVRQPRDGQNVDVYYVPSGDHKVSQMAVLVAEPREFTLVHLVGSIDMAQIASLSHSFAVNAANGSRSPW